MDATTPAREDWLELARQTTDDVIAWRRHLHANPELSFQEHETADWVAERLNEFGGFELSRPTETSVMARLVGGLPGPVIAARADMDALPIDEQSGVPFASSRSGVMHACGHDGHTAVLLAVARILSAQRDRLPGEVRFLFQHAEELFPGGAQQLVDAGVLDGVDAVLGLHLISTQEAGTIELRPGPTMAAPDTFDIEVIGAGGHAASPHEAVDPVAIGASLVTNLQMLVSRATDPLEPLVVSVTRFHAGTADNVIPGSAELGGTVRSFDAELRARMPELMERVVRGITAAHGADYRFTYQRGYHALVNDEGVTERVRNALTRRFGEDVVRLARPVMGGEDFSAYLRVVPGTFFYVGARPADEGARFPHHHPRFAIDESALTTGVAAFLTALEAMTEGAD